MPVNINYEGEYLRLKELCGELECDINSLKIELDYHKTELMEKEKQIVHLEGQVEAFKFCIAKGDVKNER